MEGFANRDPLPSTGRRSAARSGTAPRMLGRRFFARPTVDVAQELIGAMLVVDGGTADEVVARLVEVEAYLGRDDPASHAFRGPTPRASIMFQEPGHLYVYLSYGMHHCANLVAEPRGVAGAVLLRAAEVESGEEVVRRRRLRQSNAIAPLAHAALLRGPGNLCRGLALDRADNGLDACAIGARVRVVARDTVPPPIAVGTRIGIRDAAGSPLRFMWEGHRAVSAPALGPAT